MFYPVHQQVSEQGSQRNKNVLSCSRTGLSTLLLFFILFKKCFYSVEKNVQKPIGEQDKTHEFSLNDKSHDHSFMAQKAILLL